ncbi:DUF6114 domain-containing protein [Streptomyces sp. A3M-1-3]|uniref:DUF6114 domain-containing protein n=1 Tax=Streptomyces sp. A3M-1-3 TaxID=2962044 RepID=UPI0020B86B95|nr:DUF6114 domain-containing protein [Streptomyces sp. A3M-1-3]MCP3816889.1 DUF6114 domain-containing protein [Streptomyces sp. A3M-1-3]
MSAESPGQNEHYLRVFRRHFRAWRGARPYYAGLFTALSGVPIAYLPYADLQLGHVTLTMATTAGAGSLIIGVLLFTLGMTMWFHQIVRVFAGVATILLALVSIPVSNLGGFFVGLLLGLLGGALSIAWVPGAPAADPVGPVDGTPEQDPGHEPFPGPRLEKDPNTFDSTVDANGGRNSAG